MLHISLKQFTFYGLYSYYIWIFFSSNILLLLWLWASNHIVFTAIWGIFLILTNNYTNQTKKWRHQCFFPACQHRPSYLLQQECVKCGPFGCAPDIFHSLRPLTLKAVSSLTCHPYSPLRHLSLPWGFPLTKSACVSSWWELCGWRWSLQIEKCGQGSTPVSEAGRCSLLQGSSVGSAKRTQGRVGRMRSGCLVAVGRTLSSTQK